MPRKGYSEEIVSTSLPDIRLKRLNQCMDVFTFFSDILRDNIIILSLDICVA